MGVVLMYLMARVRTYKIYKLITKIIFILHQSITTLRHISNPLILLQQNNIYHA